MKSAKNNENTSKPYNVCLNFKDDSDDLKTLFSVNLYTNVFIINQIWLKTAIHFFLFTRFPLQNEFVYNNWYTFRHKDYLCQGFPLSIHLQKIFFWWKK